MCSICGILEELEELEDKAWDLSETCIATDEDVLSECSDVLWYIASIGIETGITMEELRVRELPVNNKFTNPAKILKKTYRDFNGKMPDNYKQQLWDYLAFILQCIFPAYADVEQAMEYNIIKLQNRKANGTIRGEGSRR